MQAGKKERGAFFWKSDVLPKEGVDWCCLGLGSAATEHLCAFEDDIS